MTGQIYSFPCTGSQTGKNHYHVAVAQDGPDVWVVPAFSEGGTYITSRIRNIVRRGMRADRAAVTMDNSQVAVFLVGTPWRSTWAICDADRRSRRYIKSMQSVGTMAREGMVRIGCALLCWILDNQTNYPETLRDELLSYLLVACGHANHQHPSFWTIAS